MADIVITDADLFDPSFWAGLTIDPASTLDASAVSGFYDITLTNGSITFVDTRDGSTVSYSDADLGGGSFSNIQQYDGNDGDSDVSGSNQVSGTGFQGGSGDDTFRDDGTAGGTIRGGDGNDTIQGGSGFNNIDGEGGDDLLLGGTGQSNLQGGAGNDTIDAQDSGGVLEGGEGDDLVIANENTTFADGDGGNDRLIIPQGATFTPFSPGGQDGTVTLADGGSFTASGFETVEVACFAAGTLIATPSGPVAVERLAQGDLVETLDRGPQPIRWIARRDVDGRGAHAPVRFSAGRLGNGIALDLSPLHRVMLSEPACSLLFDAPEVLSAAKYLVDGDGVFRSPRRSVTYVHFGLARHEIVFANGAAVESFLCADDDCDGQGGRSACDPASAQGAVAIPQPVRPILRRHEARLLRQHGLRDHGQTNGALTTFVAQPAGFPVAPVGDRVGEGPVHGTAMGRTAA